MQAAEKILHVIYYTTSNEIDGCTDENGNFEAIKDIIRDNSVSPAEDYFNGNVLGLTKNPNGERYKSFYE